jgi:hypothetical protein
VRLTGDDAASTRTKLIAHARQRLSTLEIILSQVAAAQPTADLDIAACMLAFPDGSHRTVFLTTTDTPRGPEVVLAGAGTDAPPARPGTTTLQLAASGQPPPPLISITNRVTLARCGTLDSGAIEVEEGPEAMAAALLLATGLREDTAAHA